MLVTSSWNWFEKGVLGPSADCYVGYLRHRGYCAGTVKAHVSSVGHFAYWLTNFRIQLCGVDEALVQQFVTKHLPSCDCPGRWQRCVIETRAALQHLLTVLRTEERIPAARPQRSLPIQSELNRYHSFLVEIGGLAPNTCVSRLAWISKFLVDRFGDAEIQFSKINPQGIVEFMTRPNDNYKPGTMGLLACALRSYFRFRSLVYGDDVQMLTAAVPNVAHWSLSTLPPHLKPEEVSHFFAAFNRRSVSGVRGYAMARCLLDMGLRASEVAGLRLDDLNWPEGTVTIRRGKSRRADILPLPATTGRAIVQYLREARPKSDSRCLFLRHRAPFDASINAEFVRGHIRRAFASCGLAGHFTGTHVLRHTAAVRMRCAGATLKEIADVLRHRSLDTTTIYSKVDIPTLAMVAAPWPGGQL